MKTYTYKLTSAVVCAMQLDDKGMRTELQIEISMLRRGARITGTLDALAKVAYHMARESGWDMSPQAMSACNRAARKLNEFIAEKRKESL